MIILVQSAQLKSCTYDMTIIPKTKVAQETVTLVFSSYLIHDFLDFRNSNIDFDAKHLISYS